ncbi:hypothetical protein [Streptomyces sp. NPDC048638]|uniref:hypothetical protein n=1 Tax=Streptomyces sp. NPDC048638 TaxID=3365580 RepID=UPI003712D78C
MDVTDGRLPVALDLSAGRIALRPLALSGFHEPWYDVAYPTDDERLLVWRPLEDLLAWADADGACHSPPRALRLIAHTSRCGSTMLANQLSLRQGTLVLKEPLFLMDAALHAVRARNDAERRSAHAVVRALLAYCDAAAQAHGRRLVVKLTSWTSLVVLDVLGGLAGPARWLLVWRDPAEVVASLTSSPPSWQALRHDPALRALLDLAAPGAASEAEAEADTAFYAHLWRALVEPFAAPEPRSGGEERVRFLDYATFTADRAGALRAAERWLRLGAPDDLPDGFAAACGRYAKSLGGEPFDPAGAHHRATLTAAGRSMVRRITVPASSLLGNAVPSVTAEGGHSSG